MNGKLYLIHDYWLKICSLVSVGHVRLRGYRCRLHKLMDSSGSVVLKSDVGLLLHVILDGFFLLLSSRCVAFHTYPLFSLLTADSDYYFVIFRNIFPVNSVGL